ncbi:hypothetical protein M1L60_21690 [Actinoplanes sp. TRM 88003]|uniref:Uncharacterized protein n=1 Tax=Paractinoplanes aksuensis TaxID=2939490 RepID=A0ABT1DRS3_9ACTN|nr:hypothetical protein [Actinoplanes aksuensis]MCO8273208.1 hypothetical protein [Actinoplanes aksuensis]
MDDMTSIDAPAVRAMGVAVTEIGDQIAEAAAVIPGWEYQGQRAVDGSTLCADQMSLTAMYWQVTLDGLGGLVRDYGGELRTAAGDFVATDQSAADRIQVAGKPG